MRSELLVTGNIIQHLNQGTVSKIKMMGLARLGLMAGSAMTMLGRESGSPESQWGGCSLYNPRIAAQP